MEEHPKLTLVRKLLAKAESPAATPEESEAYTAKAATLIAEYGIDRALLARDDPGSDPVGDRVIDLEAPYALEKADLVSAVAAHLRCRAVITIRRTVDGKVHTAHLFGHASDLERAELLFTSLLVQAWTGVQRAPVPWRESAAAYRRSWLGGFTYAVGRRLEASESDAVRASASGTALVLADRTAEVEQALREAFPDVRRARPRELSGSGGAEGWSAGQRADLGTTRIGGRRALG